MTKRDQDLDEELWEDEEEEEAEEDEDEEDEDEEDEDEEAEDDDEDQQRDDVGRLADRAGMGRFVAGLIVGSALGAAAALLFAPDTGVRTRRRLKRRLGTLRDRAEEEIRDLRREARRRLAKARS